MNSAEYEKLMNDEYVPGYTGRQVRDAINALEAERCPRCGCKPDRVVSDIRPLSATVCEPCYIQFSR